MPGPRWIRGARWAYGTAVLALDAVANAVANYPPLDTSPGITVGRIAQAVITAMAIGMAAVGPQMQAIDRRQL